MAGLFAGLATTIHSNFRNLPGEPSHRFSMELSGLINDKHLNSVNEIDQFSLRNQVAIYDDSRIFNDLSYNLNKIVVNQILCQVKWVN